MSTGPSHRRLVALQFAALLVFWLLLSWRTDPVFLVMGVVFAAVVTAVTRNLTVTILHADRPSPPLRRAPVLVVRYVIYAMWLISRIVVSSVQLAWMVLHPKMPIDPVEMTFTTQLRSPLARTFLTNSITLVPGTMTVDIDGDKITVHALKRSCCDDLVSGALQSRIAGLFDDEPQAPARPHWLTLPAPEPGAPDPTDSTQDQT